MPVNAEECRVVLLSPFDIHFSQTRIRTEFQDSHTTDETIPQIRVVPRGSSCSISSDTSPSTGEATESTASGGASEDKPASDAVEKLHAGENPGEDGLGIGEGCEDLSEEKRGTEFEVLWHPFPRIEVTKWRCKLREPDGSPKLDAAGLELYSHEERWFSFDNRRLYCLQKAAAAVWPKEVRAEVVEIPGSLARTRELRKFDTRTFGCSVLAGRRDDPTPETWSWRVAVGLPEEAQPEDGVAKQKSLRWRGAPGYRKGPNSGGGKRRNDQQEEQEGRGPELMRSALLFFLVYLGLRVVVSIFRHRFQSSTTGTPPIPPTMDPAAALGGGS